MARCIDADALQRRICGAKCGCEYEDCGCEGDCAFDHFIFHEPTVDVVPRADIEKLQECIYDLYAMLDGIIYHARNNDLSALRPFRGASGCDAYQGAPPICRKFDKVFDKHEEAISMAVKFAELKKKCLEGEK